MTGDPAEGRLMENTRKGGENAVGGKKHRTGKLKYGTVSALMLALVLAALVALNVGVQALEKKNGWRIDLSFNAITSQSSETVEILKTLKDPVRIYALFQKGNEDAPLMELLDRYSAASDLVTWEQVDPALNPALLRGDPQTIELDKIKYPYIELTSTSTVNIPYGTKFYPVY